MSIISMLQNLAQPESASSVPLFYDFEIFQPFP